MLLEELIDATLQRGRLGYYSELRYLGCGGFGIVLGAKDTLLQRNVALKIPRDQALPLDNLLYEARLLAAIAHPNIIAVFSASREACTPKHDLLFIVTEYADGGCLTDRVKNQTLSADELVPVLHQVASGLAAAHQCGIVHRDIKPENILLSSAKSSLSETRIQIADFGISVRMAANSAEVIGTPPYMSPEAWLGGFCPQSDVYSVGVMAYLLLSGQFPFDGRSSREWARMHLAQTPPRLRELCPSCPPGLEEVIAACLEKDPAKRPSSGDDLRKMLESRCGYGASITPAIAPAITPATATGAVGLINRPGLTLLADDILGAHCDAIAYSANNHLQFSGGLAKVLLDAAGPQLSAEATAQCQKYDNGVLPPGEVAVTSGHELTSRGIQHVLHASTLYWNPFTRQYQRQSDAAYLQDISKAAENTCRTASSLPDVKRLGLTMYGLRARRRLFPNVTLEALIAANLQGVARFLLSSASNTETSVNKDWNIVASAYSRDDRRVTREVARHLDRELRLMEPIVGELTDCNTEVLIISANNWLFPGSGSAKRAYNHGGQETQTAINERQSATEPLARGAIVTVPGGKLTDELGHRRHLIHAVTTWYQRRTPRGVEGRIPASPDDVYLAMHNAIREALRLRAKSVGVALMCARPGYHSLDQCRAPIEMAIAAARAVNDLRIFIAGRIRRIKFVCPSEQIRNEINKVIAMPRAS